MKNSIILFLMGCLSATLFSCLGSSGSDEVSNSPNCQIQTFTLSSDSVSGLSSVKFTIDQLSGEIYNLDSMPYGTTFKHKIVCKITYASATVSGIQATYIAKDSTFWWNGSDSLDFTQPVKFVVHSHDGVSTKAYVAHVNIHQVQPDTLIWSQRAENIVSEAVSSQKVMVAQYEGAEHYFMYVTPATGSGYHLYHSLVSAPDSWQQITLSGLPTSGVRMSQITEFRGAFYVPTTSGILYRSTDGINWSKVDGAPSVKYILGCLAETPSASTTLAAIADVNGTLTFCSMNSSSAWTTGEAVPDGFPIVGFGTKGYTAMYHDYLMVVAGKDKSSQLLNTTWGTNDGREWIKYTDDKLTFFTVREGVTVARYDSMLYMIGGFLSDGTADKKIYTSHDNGVNWAVIDSMVVLPDAYKARAYASVKVDPSQYIYIIGGKTSSSANDLKDIWYGRINRLGFKK
mgnify:CR=1 FL=1